MNNVVQRIQFKKKQQLSPETLTSPKAHFHPSLLLGINSEINSTDQMYWLSQIAAVGDNII
jgi:hypothetical protein